MSLPHTNPILPMSGGGSIDAAVAGISQSVCNATVGSLAGKVTEIQNGLNQASSNYLSLQGAVSALHNSLQASYSQQTLLQTTMRSELQEVRNVALTASGDRCAALEVQQRSLQAQIDGLKADLGNLQQNVNGLSDELVIQGLVPSRMTPGQREAAAKRLTPTGKDKCFNVCRALTIAFFVIVALVALAALIIFILCMVGHLPNVNSAVMAWEGTAAFGSSALSTFAISSGAISIISLITAGLVSVGCKKRPAGTSPLSQILTSTVSNA